MSLSTVNQIDRVSTLPRHGGHVTVRLSTGA